VIIRFFTVPKVRDARLSAGYALLFIALLYTTAPAVAAFARTNLIETVQNQPYDEMPRWFQNWENTGLLAWMDKNGDGRIQYAPGSAFGKLAGQASLKLVKQAGRGESGEPRFANPPGKGRNELHVDRDIIVLANPEIARLPNWVIALVAAGALAAALSTAAGLLLVISSSVSHDLLKNVFMPEISEKQELRYARVSAGVAVCIAGYFGINPPGFVAEVVAFAFGLAAASFFPAIVLGIFSKRMNRQGAVSGMIVGIVFTAAYIIYFKFVNPGANTSAHWLFGISPEGIGAVGMLLNFAVSLSVSRFTAPPPLDVQRLVETIRVPR
jgi:cation/acetate symporter